jgi:hypothetical protein
VSAAHVRRSVAIGVQTDLARTSFFLCFEHLLDWVFDTALVVKNRCGALPSQWLAALLPPNPFLSRENTGALAQCPALQRHSLSRWVSREWRGDPLADLVAERAQGIGGAVHLSARHRQIAVTQEIAHQETLAPDLGSAFGFRRSSTQ